MSSAPFATPWTLATKFKAPAPHTRVETFSGPPSANVTTDWTCVNSSGAPSGDVSIWWGHTPVDAGWACNTWVPACGASCTAVAGQKPKPAPPPTGSGGSAHGPHTGALVAVLPVEDLLKDKGGAWRGKANMKKSTVTTFQGSPALRVFMKKGSGTGSMPNYDQSGMLVESRHPEIAGQTSAVVAFDLFFDPDNWHFSKGGKIGGLFVGPGVASGYRHSEDGSSHRMMWKRDGGAISYVYPPSKLKQADPKLTPTGHGIGYFGDSVFPAGTLKVGAWNSVEIGLRVNTFDSSGKPNPDGLSMLTINGKSGVLNNVKWAARPDLKIDNFGFHVFSGGPDPAVVDSVLYARNFEIYRWKD